MGRQQDIERAEGRDRRWRTLNHSISAVTLIFLATVGSACSSNEEAIQAPVTDSASEADELSAESPAMRFLPHDEDLEDWRLTSDPRVYPGETSRRWLDGGATQYLDYGLVDLTVGRYETRDGGAIATVELFRFPDFVQAFGAWTDQRRGRFQSVALGNDAFSAPHSLHVWKGPFYIRVIRLENPPEAAATTDDTTPTTDGATTETAGNPATEPSIEALTRVVLEDIPAAQGLPAVLGFLPTAHRVPHSEKYQIDNGLGHPFLGNSFTVDYLVPSGGRVTGLALPSPSRETATRILDAYKSFFERNGRLLDSIPNLGEDNFTGEDQYRGRVVALRIDRFVVVFQGFATMAELQSFGIESDRRILEAIRSALSRAEKEARTRD